MHHSHILANSLEGATLELGALVAQTYAQDQIRLLTGPRLGLVMLNVRESVAERQFFAGELLVTEVTLELAGQFGFGMVLGNSPQRALAMALVDAALQRAEPLAVTLQQALAGLEAQITHDQQQLYRTVAASKVEFEVF